MPKKDKIYWMGEKPERCDLCEKRLRFIFFDSAVKNKNYWAIMCLMCFCLDSRSLGYGRGQMFGLASGVLAAGGQKVSIFKREEF